MSKSLEDLLNEGWERRVNPNNKRVTYKRPDDGKIVARRSQLRESEAHLGDILFAQKHKRRKSDPSESNISVVETEEVGASPSLASQGVSGHHDHPSGHFVTMDTGDVGGTETVVSEV